MGHGATRRLLITMAACAVFAGLYVPADARQISVCVADFCNGTRFTSYDPLPDNLAFYLTGYPEIRVIERWMVRGDVNPVMGMDKMIERARSFGADVLVNGSVKEETGKLVARIQAYNLSGSSDDNFDVAISDAASCRDTAEKASAMIRQHLSSFSGSSPEILVTPVSLPPPSVPAAVSTTAIQAEQRLLAQRCLKAAVQRKSIAESPLTSADAVSEAEFARVIARLASYLTQGYQAVFSVEDPDKPVSKMRAVSALSKGLGKVERLGGDMAATPLSRSELSDLLERYLPASQDVQGPVENPTGLVIDVRGLGLERCMSPVIECEDGSLIYPDKKNLPNLNYIQENGIASFVHDLKDAPRAGECPLIIRAIGVKGNASQIAVISKDDAYAIRAISAENDFLKKWRVTFIVDEGY